MAAGPILPNAEAAPRRTVLSSSFKAAISAGTASLAAGVDYAFLTTFL